MDSLELDKYNAFRAAFDARRQLLEDGLVDSGFRREGQFKLLRFEPGDVTAAAVFEHSVVGNEILREFTIPTPENLEIKLELYPLRLLIQKMAPGNERDYLAHVENALTAFNWVQKAVLRSAKNLQPCGDLSDIGLHMVKMMKELHPLREGISQSSEPAAGNKGGPAP